MNAKTLIETSLGIMGRDISITEKDAVAKVIDLAAVYGYGNMISWLATAWAQELRETGVPLADPEDFAGGCFYPLPKVTKRKGSK